MPSAISAWRFQADLPASKANSSTMAAMAERRPERWSELAGRIEGKKHVLPVRVYYEDTDFSGVVYHASYLRFCERGRSDCLRLLGIHHHELQAGGLSFVVRRMVCDFIGPALI